MLTVRTLTSTRLDADAHLLEHHATATPASYSRDYISLFIVLSIIGAVAAAVLKASPAAQTSLQQQKDAMKVSLGPDSGV